MHQTWCKMLALELHWFKKLETYNSGDSAMWMDKLSHGVLRVLTPLGPRYVRPSFFQRLYLLWIFRNFETLPPEVLSSRQLQLMDGLCAEQRYVALLQLNPLE